MMPLQDGQVGADSFQEQEQSKKVGFKSRFFAFYTEL